MATLLEIRNRIRQRTDNENSSFVSDSELNGLINTAYAELYGILVRFSLQRNETLDTITADGSTSYTLASDFYSLIGVWRVEGDVRIRLTRYNERFRPGSVAGPASEYRMVGMTVVLYPKPASGTYELVYVPVPSTLSADGDVLDGVLGWEELVVIDASIRVLEKEEADTSGLRQDKAIMLQRVKDESEAVEFTEGVTIQNVRYTSRVYEEGDYVGRRGIRSWR